MKVERVFPMVESLISWVICGIVLLIALTPDLNPSREFGQLTFPLIIMACFLEIVMISIKHGDVRHKMHTGLVLLVVSTRHRNLFTAVSSLWVFLAGRVLWSVSGWTQDYEPYLCASILVLAWKVPLTLFAMSMNVPKLQTMVLNVLRRKVQTMITVQ